MALSLDNEHWQQLADEHRKWLSSFDLRYLSNWEKMLKADSEAALCEAGVRRRLERSGSKVEPNESLSGKCGGPDFRCTTGQRLYYVEVTCISIATAEKRSGIKVKSTGCSPFNPLGMVEAVFSECTSKARQCAKLDGPALVAVGTFYVDAVRIALKKFVIEGLLTGTTMMAWDVDVETGESSKDVYGLTEMGAAAFLKSDPTEGLLFARNSISGVLICGLGSLPERCLGILHPNPVRPFDQGLLPDIEFGSVQIDRGTDQLSVHWSRTSDV